MKRLKDLKVLKNIKRYKYWIFVPLNLSLMISLITVYINNLKTGFMIFFPVVLFLYEIALFLFIVSVILKKFRTVTIKYRNGFIQLLEQSIRLSFKNGSKVIRILLLIFSSGLFQLVLFLPVLQH